MIIKINRVNSDLEYRLLQDLNVGIICFSIDRIYKNQDVKKYDSRALSLEEVIKIINSNERKTKISIHINYYANVNEILDAAIKLIQPDYINYYIPFYLKREHLRQQEIKNIEAYKTYKNVSCIIFGNSFEYDMPILFEIEDVKAIRSIKYLEVNIDTINTTSEFYFKSKNHYQIEQDETSDTLLETIHQYCNELPILVNDKFNAKTLLSDLKKVKATGISISLKSLGKDIFELNEEDCSLSEIADHYYSIEEINELIKGIKNHI